MEFIDREEELKALEEGYASKKASFIIIYGRRRLGKTELIKQFLKGRNGVYFLATDEDITKQLKSLSSLIGIRLGIEDLARFGTVDWESLFMRIANTELKERLVIAIDEFPHLVRADKAIPSIFQKGWELYLKDRNVMLILSGSSISIMQKEVLNQASPLYQRNTAIIKLKPLRVDYAIRMASSPKFIDALKTYFIFGGVPAYYVYTEECKNFDEVLETIFKQTSIFEDEISIILSEEAKNTGVYLDIIDFIANGVNRPSEIASKLAIPASEVIRYLNILLRIGIVEKSLPVTKKVERKSKGGVYEIKDNYALFWSRYIKRNVEKLSLEGSKSVASSVQKEFDSFASIMFERFAKDFLAFMSITRKLGFTFTKIGRWWGFNPEKKSSGNQEEIDVVALNEDTKDILFGECKWSNSKIGKEVYYDLKRKASFVQWHNNDRHEHFALFSKSGFTEEMKEIAKREHVFLFDLEAIEKALSADNALR
ncbi:MAG: ATP-binding protein [Candidatus Micrarchaeota archaeon]